MIFEYLVISVLSQFGKYHPSGNLKSNNLGIFQSLKLRIVMAKILRISLKLNFTPNLLGFYGLSIGLIRAFLVSLLFSRLISLFLYRTLSALVVAHSLLS